MSRSFFPLSTVNGLLRMKQCIILVCLAIVMTGCMRKSDRELEQAARDAEKQRNFAIAIEYYSEIVDRFQESAIAESSQYRIAVLYSNDLKDLRSAARAYLRFDDLYGKSDKAPAALFMSAYIFNNELKDLDSAKVLYQKFLEKYPGHELAESARYEVANLGKDPGQLIQPEELTATPEPAKKGTPASK